MPVSQKGLIMVTLLPSVVFGPSVGGSSVPGAGGRSRSQRGPSITDGRAESAREGARRDRLD